MKAEYFPKNFALTKPDGKKIFEFVVLIKDQAGAYSRLVETFTSHGIDIKSGFVGQHGSSSQFIANLFCEFARADCTVWIFEEELKRLPFVIRVRSADMAGRYFDKFFFPMTIMNNNRIILMRTEPLLRIEKSLVENLGSGGAALMFQEGRVYAEETLNQYKKIMPNLTADDLLENVKDGLRVTGWGIFDFRRTSDGYEVVVTDPPLIADSHYRENRFYYGVIARVLEMLYGGTLTVVTSHADTERRKLTFYLSQHQKQGF